jgi:hypothetical protein
VASVAPPAPSARVERPFFAGEAGEIVWTTAGLYTVSEGAAQRIDPSDGHVLAATRLLEGEQLSTMDISEGAVLIHGKKQVRFLHPATFAPLATAHERDRVERIPVTTTAGASGEEAFAVFPSEGGNVVRVFHRGKPFTITLEAGEEFAGAHLSEPCADCGTLAIVSLARGAGRIIDLASGRTIAELPFDLGNAYAAPTARVVGEHIHALLTYGDPDKPSDTQKKGSYQRYNVRTGSLEMTIPIPCGTAMDPTPSPDGRQVLFSCDYGDAVLVDVSQRKVQARFKNFVAGCDNGPSLSSYWDPSGKKVHKEGGGGEAIVEIPSGKLVCADDPHLAGVPYELVPMRGPSSAIKPPPKLTVPACGANSFAVVAAPFRRGAASHVVTSVSDDEPVGQTLTLITQTGVKVPLRPAEKVFAYDPGGTLLAVLEETAPFEEAGPPRPFQGKLHLRDAATGARRW